MFVLTKLKQNNIFVKENLSLEVKIIDKKNPKNIDLIELNLNLNK